MLTLSVVLLLILQLNTDVNTCFVSAKFSLWLKISNYYPLNGFPGGSDGRASVYNPGDQGSIPRLERSPGEGNGNPLQHYCLENLMDKGAWYATVHGVAKTRTRLNDFSSLILDRNFSVFLFVIMTSLMVSFIFISAFSMGGRMTLICSSLIVQNI